MCDCSQCIKQRDSDKDFFDKEEHRKMIVCEKCGFKRCPHASDHKNKCTGSNEIGQIGSAYQ